MWYLDNLFLSVAEHIFLAKFLDAATRNGTAVQTYLMAGEEEEEEITIKKQPTPNIRCLILASLVLVSISIL